MSYGPLRTVSANSKRERVCSRHAGSKAKKHNPGKGVFLILLFYGWKVYIIRVLQKNLRNPFGLSSLLRVVKRLTRGQKFCMLRVYTCGVESTAEGSMQMKKSTMRWIGAGLFAIAVLLRVVFLTRIPLRVHPDEAGLGLNAWTLAEFGTDRYGNFLPVCPLNFYGEQSAFYTYFCALLVKLFGLSLVTLRTPAVVMGLMTVLFGTLLIREEWKAEGALWALVIFGTAPWFVAGSRYALDCNSMLGMSAIALFAWWYLCKRAAAGEQKHYGAFCLVGILFGAILYTYIIAAITVLIFWILSGLYYWLYRREGRGKRFRQLCFTAFPLLVMAIPLVLVVCVNTFGWDTIETPFFTIPRLLENRTNEVGLSLLAWKQKLMAFVKVLTTDGIYGSPVKEWNLFRISVPFLLLGGMHSLVETIRSVRAGKQSLHPYLIFWCIGSAVTMLLCGTYTYHVNGIFVALVCFAVDGIWLLTSKLRSRTVSYAVLACLYAASAVVACKEYYENGAQDAYQIYGGVEAALDSLEAAEREKEIYIPDEIGEIYFLSKPLTPEEVIRGMDEYGMVREYKNLHFRMPESYDRNVVFILHEKSGVRPKDLWDGEYCEKKVGHYLVLWCTTE